VEPNATLQAPPIAEARHERTLFAVACKRLLHERTLFAVACKRLLNEALRAVSCPPCVQIHPEELAIQHM